MNTTEDVPEVELATTANGDQPAEAATEAAEPAAVADADPEAAPLPQSDVEQEKADSKPPSSKANTSPAKGKASEPVKAEERPSGRRERKQTAFFQPEKKTETEKFEIKEVTATGLLSVLVKHGLSW